MKALTPLALAAAFTLAAASTAFAQQSDHSAHHAASAQATASQANADDKNGGTAAQMADGEIKKVNLEAEKITIRHSELKNLGMPAMTMVFRAKDPAMLGQIKEGDRIKFVAERVGGQLTVTQMEVQQ